MLLRTVVGSKPPKDGEIRLFGYNLSVVPDDARRMLLRRCGVLFQNSALFSSLTVRENVEVPLREAAKLLDALCEAITSLKIGLAGLPPDTADLYPAQLSRGMQKRVALARAIALDPELLLLDEPTAGLDSPTAAPLDRLLLDLSRALGLTMTLVTHDLDSLCAVSDRVTVLVDGRIIATSSIDSRSRPNDITASQ